jgi:hypothetical protein
MIYGPKDDGTYVVEFMMTKPYFFLHEIWLKQSYADKALHQHWRCRAGPFRFGGAEKTLVRECRTALPLPSACLPRANASSPYDPGGSRAARACFIAKGAAKSKRTSAALAAVDSQSVGVARVRNKRWVEDNH